MTIRRDIHQIEQVVDHQNDERSQERAPQRTDSPEETGAADDDGGNGIEFEAATGPGITDGDAGGEDDGTEGREEPADHVGDQLAPVDGDAGEASRLLIAANGVDGAPVRCEAEYDRADDERDAHDPDRHRRRADHPAAKPGVATRNPADRPAVGDGQRGAAGDRHHG